MTLWLANQYIDKKLFSVQLEIDTTDYQKAETYVNALGLGLKLEGRLLAEYPGPRWLKE